MPTYTEHLNLEKPTGNENINIEIINANMDKVDENLGEQSQQISDCLESIGDKAGLLTSVKTNLVSAINSLLTLATTTVNGLMSKEDKVKLNGITIGANNYVHPGSGTNPHGTTKTDVGLGSVQNYGIATTAEAQAGAINNKYMTPALVVEACKKFGGDIVGKTYQYELVSAGAINTVAKSFSHANGGMVRILPTSHGCKMSLTVDGVVKFTNKSMYELNAPYNDINSNSKTIIQMLDIPFNQSFVLTWGDVIGTNNIGLVLHYYLN